MQRGSGPLECGLVLFTLGAFQFNDVVGSVPLYGACGLWLLYGASRSNEMLAGLTTAGLFVWLYPALGSPDGWPRCRSPASSSAFLEASTART